MSRWWEESRAWWISRSERERWMLRGLAAVVAALGAWYGLVVPLQAWGGAASDRYARAASDLNEAQALSREIARLQQVRGGARSPPADPVRRTAAAAGLTISREQPEAGGGLSVWTQPASAKAVFTWLLTLQAEHGVGVRQFEANKGAEGMVEVRAAFGGAGV